MLRKVWNGVQVIIAVCLLLVSVYYIALGIVKFDTEMTLGFLIIGYIAYHWAKAIITKGGLY